MSTQIQLIVFEDGQQKYSVTSPDFLTQSEAADWLMANSHTVQDGGPISGDELEAMPARNF